MFRLDRRQAFGPSCPSGGTWYACGYGSKFVGCCRTQPCNNGCPAGNLKPASFNPNFYGQFSDQQCETGSWYTCKFTVPPFMGCCKSAACNVESGCPVADLVAGYLSNNTVLAAQFSPSGDPSATVTSLAASSSISPSTSSRPTTSAPASSSSSSAVASSTTSSFTTSSSTTFSSPTSSSPIASRPTSSSSSTISSSTTSSRTISATSSQLSSATPTSDTGTVSPSTPLPVSHSTPNGAIIGGAVGGGICLLGLLGLLLFFYFRRRTKASRTFHPEEPRARSEQVKYSPATEGFPSPAPLYSPYRPSSAFPASPPLPKYAALSQVDTPRESVANLHHMEYGFPTTDAGAKFSPDPQTARFELHGEDRALRAELEGQASPSLRGAER